MRALFSQTAGPFLIYTDKVPLMIVGMSMLLDGLLLAEEAGAKPGGSPWFFQALPFIMIGLLFFFMFLRPQQREQRAREMLLKSIKKNDRVLTAGGIFGVVTNVQAEINEVTIRVDEKNDTKLRVQLSSVARVLAAADGGDDKKDGDSAKDKTE